MNMQKAFVDPQKCILCESCSASHACPTNAIFRIDEEEPCIVESKVCHGCGDCMPQCPAKAIMLKTT